MLNIPTHQELRNARLIPITKASLRLRARSLNPIAQNHRWAIFRLAHEDIIENLHQRHAVWQVCRHDKRVGVDGQKRLRIAETKVNRRLRQLLKQNPITWLVERILRDDLNSRTFRMRRAIERV